MAKTRTEIQAKYDAANRRSYTIKFNLNYDADIIAKLDSIESKNGYIRDLIRQDLARTCPEKTGSVPDSGSVPTSPTPVPAPKKSMSIDQLYAWLQKYANKNYDGSLYDVLNILSSKLMGYETDE